MAAYTRDDLAAYLYEQDGIKAAQADLALDVAGRVVKSYTRGRGFTAGVPADDLAAVILLVAARLYHNPGFLRAETVGSVAYTSAVAGFQGFTLAELAVLNGYRRRAA